MRALAENNIGQTRELYERSKDAFEEIIKSWERTFDAAGQGVMALKRKFVDVTQRNINSGFEFAKSVAGARDLAEAMELHASYWRKQFGTFGAQAEEVRTLSTRVTADVTERIKAQVKRSKDALHNATNRSP